METPLRFDGLPENHSSVVDKADESWLPACFAGWNQHIWRVGDDSLFALPNSAEV